MEDKEETIFLTPPEGEDLGAEEEGVVGASPELSLRRSGRKRKSVDYGPSSSLNKKRKRKMNTTRSPPGQPGQAARGPGPGVQAGRGKEQTETKKMMPNH